MARLLLSGAIAYGLYWVGREGHLGPDVQDAMWQVHRQFMGLFGVQVPALPPGRGGY